MPIFNLTLYHSYLLSGYKYVLYTTFGSFGMICPLKERMSDFVVSMAGNSYLLPITDEQVKEMACGIDEFDIFVADDNFPS